MRCSPALLLLACSDYGLNDKASSTPGVQDSAAECALDDVAASSAQIDQDCTFQEEPGEFDPTIEWQWTGSNGAPGYDEIMMMPTVGDVDADGVPEVVFTTYADPSYTSAGALVVVSGDGAGEESAWTSIGGYSPSGSGGVALGDLEGDGVPEIIVVSVDSRLLALHADGTLLWATDARPDDFTNRGYPLIADLDGDGLAEVVCGRAIFDHQGTLLSVGEHGIGGSAGIPVVADLDGDGQQEVIVGNAAWHRDGGVLWSNDLPDGHCAVGDFDADGQGEVVSVRDGAVYLIDTDGSTVWGPGAVPGGGGGPPTVADFDGDGWPEVGVAGYSGYVVYDTDGSLLWQADSTDESSARTGSSVFDFEGDGQWEVVYADELVLWVFDGATGAPLLAEDRHSSWTLYEYPVIADVDGDGASEMVLASNDSINAGWRGVTVIGDATGSWAPTTPTWNQHAYHINKVNDELSIPAHPVMNWQVGHNSYRAGGLRDTPGIPAPNLQAAILDACWRCGEDGGSVDLVVQLSNTGTGDIDGRVGVAVYEHLLNGDVALLDVIDVVPPGHGQASPGMALSYDLHPLDWIDVISVRVDDSGQVGAAPTSGAVDECTEDDNTDTLASPGC